MNDFERLTRILERHLSPTNARGVIRHALGEHRLTASTFTLGDLATIYSALQRGLRLFTSETAASLALKDLAGLREVRSSAVEPCSIAIEAEADIARARSAARHICEQVGAKGFTVQKVTTIVSELARNIVSYTQGGKVDLCLQVGTKRRISIRAIDRGPGIANLTHVMSGDYQSKTGLGRGLIGTKRLSDHFDITTGPNGTHVISEVAL